MPSRSEPKLLAHLLRAACGLGVATAFVALVRDRVGLRLPALVVALAFVGGLAFGLSYARFHAPAAPVAGCRSEARPMQRLELLFGTRRRNGRHVTEAEWADFLDSEVARAFPAGLTVLTGPGRWRAGDGHVEVETSKMLVVWYERNARNSAEIERIRSLYKQRFDQDSVMRVDSLSCVSF